MMNTSPWLNFTNGTLNYTFYVGDVNQIMIPPIIDKEENSPFQITISTSPTNRQTMRMPYFMTFAQTT